MRNAAFRAAMAALAAVWVCCVAPALAQTGAGPEIVQPSGNPKPQYSKQKSPSAADLIETWRSANQFLPKRRVDNERFEILDRRVTTGRISRAFLQFRILSAHGDAAASAAAHCPGRTRPIEIQVYFQWNNEAGNWTPLSTRGEGDEDLCSDARLWTPEQIETLVNPAPLPVPPRISRRDVSTPAPGSPERTALMNALRPR